MYANGWESGGQTFGIAAAAQLGNRCNPSGRRYVCKSAVCASVAELVPARMSSKGARVIKWDQAEGGFRLLISAPFCEKVPEKRKANL